MKLTEHFQLDEFTRSSTATGCGIDNSPQEAHIANLKTLCEQVLEPLRLNFGVPIIISSGYRCPKLNSAVGGVINSQHTKGEAADLRIPNLTTGRQWMRWIIDNLAFDQCIMEHSKNNDGTTSHWIHVSYCRQYNRQSVISNLW